ncbi:MAG TPA: SpvB/TcaC N-terminal domain-containing protein, partial [Candidatus Thermoplasmatota archaeon]
HYDLPTTTADGVTLTAGSGTFTPDPNVLYGDINIHTGNTVVLGAGDYFASSWNFEPGVMLSIDNTAGLVRVFSHGSFRWKGTMSLADPSRDNVLFVGTAAGTFDLDAPFRGTVVAPLANIILATTSEGHRGAWFGASVLARPNTTYTHGPVEGLDPDAEPDPDCSPNCDVGEPCNPTGAEDCAPGLACGNNNGPIFGTTGDVCWEESCNLFPWLDGCLPRPDTCMQDSDCPFGKVCGVENGLRFGDEPTVRYCWDPICNAETQAGCDDPALPCGLCTCQDNCVSRSCGDDPGDDGCGGTCTAFCEDGEPNCTGDADCQSGSVCLENAGAMYGFDPSTSVCVPLDCIGPIDVESIDCGTTTSRCGLCPDCSGPDCGVEEPVCDPACGPGEHCNGDGVCLQRQVTPAGLPAPLATSVPEDLGTLEGDATVTASGTLAYRIPIPVPPAGGGLEPEIALVHSGSAQSSEVGVGWALEGISSIGRCPKINATDGAPAPVEHTLGDRFCLDDQYLIEVGGGGGTVEYRTEVDTHARIRHFSTPNVWEVVTKNGRTKLYIQPVAGEAGEGDQTDAWMLSFVQDRAGNRMRFFYNRRFCPSGGSDCADRETFLARIDYNEHSSANGFRASDRKVTFNYEERGLNQIGFAFGTEKRRVRRLGSIETSVEGEPVRTFQLDYDVTNARLDYLTGVEECTHLGTSSPVCKPATTFTYDITNHGLVSQGENWGCGAANFFDKYARPVVFRPTGDRDYLLADGRGLGNFGSFQALRMLAWSDEVGPFSETCSVPSRVRELPVDVVAGPVDDITFGNLFTEHSAIDLDGDGRDELLVAMVNKGTGPGDRRFYAAIVTPSETEADLVLFPLPIPGDVFPDSQNDIHTFALDAD